MKTSLLILTFLISQLSIANGIVELTKELSNIYNKPLTTEELDTALSNYYSSNQKSNPISILTLDSANAYIKLNNYDNLVTIRYWELSNGKKLICLNNWVCGPVCGSEWEFFEYNDTTFSKVSNLFNTDSIITKEEYFDFEKMKKENSKEDYDNLLNEAYLSFNLILPKVGNNLKLMFQPNIDDKRVADRLRLKRDIKGISLIWKENSFHLGEWIK